MPASSVPKYRLVELIVSRLNATTEAMLHFRIGTAASVEERLMSFSKPEIISFIESLGENAKKELDQLESAFPLRRPPTLYLAFMESHPSIDAIMQATQTMAREPRAKAHLVTTDEPIGAVFVDQGARLLQLKGRFALQLSLRYEKRIELIEANPKSDGYGMPIVLTSLETAFAWIPSSKKPKHAVIASCDYSAVRHLISFLHSKLDLRLYLTYLHIDTLHTLVSGALPRSATFTTTIDDPDEVKTLTISDPILSSKPVFASAVKSSSREQTAGFYVDHPGLPSGGMGISRREGRVWIPSRLDYIQLADLALQLIEQTETKLKAATDPGVLVAHYYGSKARIADRELSGPSHIAWKDLLRTVLQAAGNENRQAEVSISLLERLVKYQTPLSLTTWLNTECPSCGYASLATCPTCKSPLSLRLAPNLRTFCPSRQHSVDTLICDCGTELQPSLVADVYIIPEPPLIDAICRAASTITGSPFDAFFIISGTLLRLVPAVPPSLPEQLSLADLSHWKSRAHISNVKLPAARNRQALIHTLNKTKEKCFRDAIRPSVDRCTDCKANMPDPDWLSGGDLCLPRILGIAIDEAFDGVHHGLELADIKYGDTVLATGAPVKLGIHVKSRVPKPPPQGVGRSKHSVKGLYAQLVFSAYKVRSGNPKLDVIGIAMPNILLSDVEESMRFAVNKMGYSFLAITEDDWFRIVRVAEEKIAVGV